MIAQIIDVLSSINYNLLVVVAYFAHLISMLQRGKHSLMLLVHVPLSVFEYLSIFHV